MATKTFALIKTAVAKKVAALKQLGGVARRSWKVYAKAYKKLTGASDGDI